VVGTRQAAQRLGVTQRQVRRLVAAGLLEAQPLGDHSNAPLVISEESLERLAVARATDPPRPGRRRETVERIIL
jgi:hypothetical protein